MEVGVCLLVPAVDVASGHWVDGGTFYNCSGSCAEGVYLCEVCDDAGTVGSVYLRWCGEYFAQELAGGCWSRYPFTVRRVLVSN